MISIPAAPGLNGALPVPANPSPGRTIVDGQYFLRGQLIHETQFAHDPKHPRSSSGVPELITAPATLPLPGRRAEESVPERATVIGDAANSEDLRKWAALRNDCRLMTAGAGVDGALLRLPVSCSQPKPAEGTELFVCGSASEVTLVFVARQAERGVLVFSLRAR